MPIWAEDVVLGSDIKGPTHCAVFSAQAGKHLLTASQDRLVRLYNPSSGLLVQKYAGHGYEVLEVAPSHDNTRLASCGGDRSVFLWDVASAATVKRFSGHSARVNTVAFNSESTVLASGSFDATVKLWDLKSQQAKPIQTLDEAKDSVTCMLIVSDTYIMTGSVDGHVRTYDLRAGQLTSDFFEDPVTSLSLTKDERAMLVSTLKSNIILLDCESGTMLAKYTGHTNTSYRSRHALDANNELVLAGDEAGRLYTWDLASSNIVDTQDVVPPTEGGKQRACLSTAAHSNLRDGRIAVAGADGLIRILNKKRTS